MKLFLILLFFSIEVLASPLMPVDPNLNYSFYLNIINVIKEDKLPDFYPAPDPAAPDLKNSNKDYLISIEGAEGQMVVYFFQRGSKKPFYIYTLNYDQKLKGYYVSNDFEPSATFNVKPQVLKNARPLRWLRVNSEPCVKSIMRIGNP